MTLTGGLAEYRWGADRLPQTVLHCGGRTGGAYGLFGWASGAGTKVRVAVDSECQLDSMRNHLGDTPLTCL